MGWRRHFLSPAGQSASYFFNAMTTISNTLLPKVGEYDFLAEPFHCDLLNRLFVGHLGNHMLNAADFHSNDRGYGMHYLNTIHKTWVLSRLVIDIERLPKAYQHFTVQTWVEGVMRYFTDRDFAILATDGTPYGYGRSVWAMIDTDTRQPTDIMAINNALISQYVEKEKPCPIDKISRVKMGAEAEYARTINTSYSDVDINGHINSVKYIEHVLDLWPVQWHATHRVQRLEVAYVAEAHGGDQLLFYRQPAAEPDTWYVRIVKKEANKEENVEVCRCKVKFVKE